MLVIQVMVVFDPLWRNLGFCSLVLLRFFSCGCCRAFLVQALDMYKTVISCKKQVYFVPFYYSFHVHALYQISISFLFTVEIQCLKQLSLRYPRNLKQVLWPCQYNYLLVNSTCIKQIDGSKTWSIGRLFETLKFYSILNMHYFILTASPYLCFCTKV